MRALDRFPILVRDRLRFSPAVLRGSSWAMERQLRRQQPRDANAIAAMLERVATAARAGHGRRSTTGLQELVDRWLPQWSPAEFAWARFFRDTDSTEVRKALILKRPVSPAEKGVLFVAFENQWIRLLRHGRIEALARDYDLVLSPTWSPPQDLAFYLAVRMWPNPLYTLLSNFDDAGAMRGMGAQVVPIPLLASSWVNPDLTEPGGEAKEYDVAMLANFSIYKRHFALFRALRRLPGVRALLLGTGWEGRTRATLEREAEMFGVRGQITIAEGLPDAEMFRALRSARVSVIMSMVEGSCVAVVESLFADVPVGLLREARIGSSAFIHSATGRLLRSGHLAADLRDFLAHAGEYHPRAWALAQGIGCRESSAALNQHLREAAMAAGRPWTVDLAAMHWRPNARYLRAEDRAAMTGEYARFPAAYGVSLELVD